MNNAAIIEIIDDNADIRRMLGLILGAQGFHVRTHESATSFLATERPNEPRLLILDVRMPGMSGLELHRRLEEQGHHDPVIFMSGECQPHESAVAESSAPVAFLWKPFSTQQLLDAIELGLKRLR